MNKLTKILRPLASLRITVTLLAAAMVLIFAGTNAQRTSGIWDVKRAYFQSWVPWVQFQDLLPFWRGDVKGGLPFVGGYLLILLLLVNLLSAHATRFKFTWRDLILIPELGAVFALGVLWQDGAHVLLTAAMCLAVALFIGTAAFLKGKRTGVVLIHLSLLLLLGGEVVTGQLATEGQMRIDEGQTVQHSYDIRETELAVIDASPSDHDNVVVVADRLLQRGGAVRDAKLPFDLTVVKYYPNSDTNALPDQPLRPGEGEALATAGTLKDIKVADRPRASGTKGKDVDLASAFVNVSKAGRDYGTFLLSTQLVTQHVEVDGKQYELALRFRHEYKPYSVTLKKFTHEVFPGTGKPRNFAALIRLRDPRPERNEDREVEIKMNAPLRYGGETFYQASFDDKTDRTTVLQVVRNPGWLVPYVAIVIGAVGMAIHFSLALLAFLSRKFYGRDGVEISPLVWVVMCFIISPLIVLVIYLIVRRHRAAKPQVVLPAARAKPGPPKKGGRSQIAAADAYTLQPTAGVASARFLVPAGCALVALMVALWPARPSKVSNVYDFEGFGAVPMNFEGRVMPLDSVARNTLRVISTYESVAETTWSGETKTKKTVPAIEWLAEVMGQTERAEKLEVYRIDNAEVLSMLGLTDTRELPNKATEYHRKLYSLAEIKATGSKLPDQFFKANQVAGDAQSVYQKKVVELGQHMMLQQKLTNLAKLYVVAPIAAGQEWRTLEDVVRAARERRQVDPAAEVEPDPAAVAFVNMVEGYRQGNATDFNAAVTGYHSLVDHNLGGATTRAEFEAFFNRFAPFTSAMVLYVFAFVLVAASWLGWTRPLSRGALAFIAVALLVHTFGLVSRLYISGRPPVTNLVSSAIFIGWGGVLLCLAFEAIFRNTIGTAVAAVIGFAPLLLAGAFASVDASRGEGDSMAQLQAVLDTNFWLATHVVAISIGYLATLVAWLFGLIFIVRGVFSDSLDAVARKDLSRMIYGTVCFAMLFSFVGTILGGIWADQSWGRFWGWDPKENGAILIVLWNAIVLHARWGGLVRERGLAILATGGSIVTMWSWVGTNMLGFGLHSYGAMDGAVAALLVFWLSQIAVIFIGSLPLTAWKSYAADAPAGGNTAKA